jgi:HAD superfamily hydrolase (TIGR01509 family)
MAVDAVVFDVGETLVDETGMWLRAAAAAGVTPFTLMGVLGGLAATNRQHDEVWGVLGVEPAAATWEPTDFYADALPCLDRLRTAGFRVAAVGNTPLESEEMLRPHVDVLGSSGRWGIAKPAPEFFARIVELVGVPPARIAYVGDRVDNDVAPALAAGMVGVHIRRGPWGHFHVPPPGALAIRALDELPAALA